MSLNIMIGFIVRIFGWIFEEYLDASIHKKVILISSNLCKTLSCKVENCKYGKNPTISFAKHMQKVCMISFEIPLISFCYLMYPFYGLNWQIFYKMLKKHLDEYS